MKKAWCRWWRRSRSADWLPGYAAARRERGRDVDSGAGGRGVGGDGVDDVRVVVFAGPVWVRLKRGSKWHRAGAVCAARTGAMVEFSGPYPPRDGGYVVCLECAAVSGIAEWAATYVPPAERTAEIPMIVEPAALGSVTRGPRVPAPGRHRVDAPTGEIPRIPPHITTRPLWPHSSVGADAPGSWYLPGTSTPGDQGIASAA